MSLRVAHVGTGNVGRLALRQLITDPRFDLVALGVSTPAKLRWTSCATTAVVICLDTSPDR